MRRLLIVEDDITFALMLKTWLTRKGFEAETVSRVDAAQQRLEASDFSLVLTDMRLPDRDGIFLLQWIADNRPSLPAIVMTSYADIQTAVRSMKLGARDYVAKPVNPEELLAKIEEALSAPRNETADGKAAAGKNVPGTEAYTGFVEGRSEAARRLYDYVRLVAPTNMSVLVNGASGTGKEHIARMIHEGSKRRGKPFVAIDCGAIPRDLAASEFFGHVKGSFTGAQTDKRGAFEAANGGTLFLDEIGNLSYEVQVQLLRALQERRIRPVGGTEEVEVDIRLVSATNENLEAAIAEKNFREDFFHRINEFTLRMPDLREQREDIMLYADFFLDQANRELERSVVGFDAGAVERMMAYDWPGNLRQLKNAVRCATLLASSDYITCRELPAEVTRPVPVPVPSAAPASVPGAIPVPSVLRDRATEIEQIRQALRLSGDNKSKAARLLGIDRKTLYNKLKAYDIE